MASLGESIARRIAWVGDVERVVGPLAGAAVLDLGCGRHAYWTRAYVARGARVTGVELDPVRCREARERLLADPPAGDGRVLGIVRGSGEHLPLAASSVCFVHCAQVLEHVRRPDAFLAELRRVLQPGGHAYLTAINRFALRDPHFGVVGVNYLPRALGDQVLRWLGATNPEGGQTLAEMHYYSRPAFRRLCAESGLDLVVDLKQQERLAKHGPLRGRLADAWGTLKGAAFHTLVQRRDPA